MKKKLFIEDIGKITERDEEAVNILRRRALIGIGVIMFFLLIIISRFWYLQINLGEHYRSLSETNRVRIRTIPPPRGHIFDKYDRKIVTNRPSFNVSLVRADSYDIQDVLKRLSVVLDEDIEVLWERIRKGSATPRHLPITLKEDVDWQTLAYLENNKYKFSGVRIEVQPVRVYHYGDLAANIIGYIGSINPKELEADKDGIYEGGDLIGKRGLERIREGDLRGEKGSSSTEVNASGFEQQQLKYTEPLPGRDIKLTLDSDLQKAAEQYMAISDKAGAVVAMEVDTGRMLVAVSAPSIHLEDFLGGISQKNWKALLDNPRNPLLNKVVQGVYPPGSTYKIVTALAGLSEGVIDLNTTFYCPGHYYFGRRLYRCWKHSGHGSIHIKRAIIESCDVYFYQVGQRLGVDRLAKYAKKLGLGARSGIELEYEKRGIVPTKDWKRERFKEKWHEGETLSIAIGQGFNNMTPLQICLMTAAVANGGKIYQPQIVESVMITDGEVIEKFTPKLISELSSREKSYLRIVQEGLFGVVQGKRGTARNVRIKGLTVAGKTGTAQVVRLAQHKGFKEQDTPYKYRDHAWFTCYAPADNPKIAVTVLVEHGLHGGSGAGPIARVVLKKYFGQYLLKQAQKDAQEEKDKKA